MVDLNPVSVAGSVANRIPQRYTRKELGFRTALLYSGSLISGAFSGLLTAGITDGMDGVRGILAW